MNRILPSLCGIVERHCTDSHRLTAISGLTLFRIENATRPQHLIYHPRILVVAQGSKRVQLGRSSFWLNPKKILVVTVDVPVATQIYTATNGTPHLAFILSILIYLFWLRCCKRFRLNPLAHVLFRELRRLQRHSTCSNHS
ncbi:AraC family transcriptional regulator [Brenneria goodwinii]|uniref:AraC family transcriptional regulator n=1 Tax=Brenneria goodwinii TaxID=1109412 RepID=UPI0036F32957